MSRGWKVTSVLLWASLLVYGQEFLASISGRVSDRSGAAISDAKVTVKQVSTGAVASATTDANGAYQALGLNPGGYEVTVEKQGFSRSVNTGVQLDVAQKTQLDVTLEVGSLQQQVEVTANTSVVQAESADQGLTVDTARIESAPLQGRNIFAAAWSSPGVAVTSGAQRLRPFDTGGSSAMSINGGRPSSNEILIDGVSNVNPSGTSAAYIPPVDSTEEFRVQTTNFDAQYGWTTGGILNMVTKGGTNAFHGLLYEYLQNTHLDANTFGSNYNGVPRSSSHINTFGGNVSGPILKNKLFFFFSYEDLRQVIPDPFVTSVPTALQRSGNFSQTYYGTNTAGVPQLQTIYNPFTTIASASGTLSRSPFAGNVIPTSLLNPIAVKTLSIIPLGDVPGNSVTNLSNLTNNGSSRKFTDFFPEEMARVDYQIAENSKLFIRYGENDLSEERGFHYSTNSTKNVAETSANAPFERNNKSATVQFTHIFNPTTVLELRSGLLYFVGVSGSNFGANYDLTSLGFSPQFAAEAAAYFPKFNWSNYEGAGTTPSQYTPVSENLTFQGSLDKTFGQHTLRTGADFRLQRVDNVVPGYVAGNFTFDSQFTGVNPLVAQANTGNSIASFLLGTPQSGLINVNNDPARQQKLFSLFAQDDYRVNQRLTVNFGLRWDYLGPMTDRFDALTRGFAFNTPNPLQVPGLNLMGGLLYVNTNGQPRGAYNQRWGNLGPRAGFAFRLNEKTVLRAGYGLFYGQDFNDPGNAPGFSQTTNMVTFIQAGIPANTLTNPFPTGILTPVGNSQGLATALGQSFSFANTDGALPLVQQFAVNVERELPARVLLSVGYVGSRSRHLDVSQQINALSAQNLALGATALNQSVPNPMAGKIPGTSLNGATITRQQLLLPYPEFLGITENFEPVGRAKYDGLQVLVAKRMASGLSVSASYTYSKTFNWTSFQNPQFTTLEKVVAPWDVTHSLQINGVYDLPFGTAKRYGSNLPSFPRYLASGWEISALGRFQTGQPLPFPANAAATGVSPVISNPNLNEWMNTCTLLANGTTRGCVGNEQPAWTIRQPDTLQTWSSYISQVRMPGIHNLDLSVIKSNRLTERLALIFRTDFINATNSPQFYNGPIDDVNNANFGRIAGAEDQTNLPRFIQFSMKLRF